MTRRLWHGVVIIASALLATWPVLGQPAYAAGIMTGTSLGLWLIFTGLRKVSSYVPDRRFLPGVMTTRGYALCALAGLGYVALNIGVLFPAVSGQPGTQYVMTAYVFALLLIPVVAIGKLGLQKVSQIGRQSTAQS